MEELSLIKKIEAYLHQTLKANEAQAFETEMASDPGLQKLVEQYRETFQALKQQWLRMGVKAAAKSLQILKLIKFVGISIAGIITLSVLYFSFGAKGSFENKKVFEDKTIKDSVVSEVRDSIRTSSTQGVSIPFGSVQQTEIPLSEKAINDYKQIISIGKLFSKYRNNLAPDTQYFTISNLKDTILYGSSGTQIDIPARSLINYRTKQSVAETVKIILFEFNDYFNLYKANVSTVSNGHLLQSGGSCFLKATDGEDSVYVRTGLELKLSFECESQDTAMRTFYGETYSDGIVRWQPSEEKRSPEIFRADTQSQGAQLTGGKLALTKDTNVTCDTFYFKKTYITTSSATGRRVFTHYYEESKSKFYRTFVSDNRSHDKWGEFILQLSKRYSGAQNGGPRFIPNSKVTNAIYSHKFGYINCDHFIKEEHIENITLLYNDTLLESYLFFKDFRSCMVTIGDAFQNVPHNSDVLLLSILRKNNQLYMCLKSLRTSNEIFVSDVIPLNIDKIKLELDRINTSRL